MTNFIVSILELFNGLIKLLLTPIDLLLSNVIPSYDTISENISSLFEYLYDTFLFVINWINIPPSAITLLVGYLVFKLTLFFGSLGLKLILKWYHILKS